jgi:3-phosphoshikimate 1-carboxyvinyltransferase
MGADIRIVNQRSCNNEPVADIEVFSSSLKAVPVDKEYIANIIDEIPILCVAAAFAEGETVISGAKELRYKESDRIKAITMQFNKAGAAVYEMEDGLKICGDPYFMPKGGIFESYGDHRIAMSLAVMGLRAKKSFVIPGSACIDTSFPGFETVLKKSLNK